MSEQYVTMYAKLTCDMGCMENYLNVGTDHGVYKVTVEGESYPVMNGADHIVGENIPQFGRCKSPTNMDYEEQSLQKKVWGNIKNFFVKDGKCECTPKILTEWIEVKEDNILEGKGVLTEKSKLVCANGGIISIVIEKEETE